LFYLGVKLERHCF